MEEPFKLVPTCSIVVQVGVMYLLVSDVFQHVIKQQWQLVALLLSQILAHGWILAVYIDL